LLHWKSESAERCRTSAVHALQSPPSVTPTAGTAVLMNGWRDVRPNGEIFSQYEPVSNVHTVVSGAIRLTRLMKDGRRQIGAFYLPGDLFGLESEERHSFSAEAIVNSRVGFSKRSAFLDAAMGNQALAFQLWTTTAAHLQRAQCHMSVLGRSTAQERIANFLLDMESRLSSIGEIELPMPRRDIADYLGLTIETVSRIFHLFERKRIISIPDSRRVVLSDPKALLQMSEA